MDLKLKRRWRVKVVESLRSVAPQWWIDLNTKGNTSLGPYQNKDHANHQATIIRDLVSEVRAEERERLDRDE